MGRAVGAGAQAGKETRPCLCGDFRIKREVTTLIYQNIWVSFWCRDENSCKLERAYLGPVLPASHSPQLFIELLHKLGFFLPFSFLFPFFSAFAN